MDKQRRERAKEIVMSVNPDSMNGVDRAIASIEQSLADERKRAFEEAATMCEAEALIDDERGYYGKEMAKAIRAKAAQ